MTIGQISVGIIRHQNLPVADQATVKIKEAFTQRAMEYLEYYHKTANDTSCSTTHYG